MLTLAATTGQIAWELKDTPFIVNLLRRSSIATELPLRGGPSLWGR